MLRDQDVFAAIPPCGFIRDYVSYAYQCTAAPVAYHLACGLALLAVSCPPEYGMFYVSKIHPTMFGLLVGRSGEDMKSSAIGIARDVLEPAALSSIGDYPGSSEGLIDSLAAMPRQIIFMSEFGKLLSQAQRGYFETVKLTLTDLWDSTPTHRAKANGKRVRVENPRLSLLAACSIPYLERHTETADWTGGFMGRWAVMYAQRERTLPFPRPDRSLLPGLVDAIAARSAATLAGWCDGFDREAEELFVAWHHDVTNRDLPPTIEGIRSRAPTIAMRTALLYGWDFGPAVHGEPWLMSTRELVPAIQFAELHVQSVVGLSEHICEHADARLRRAVLVAIREMGGIATLGQLLGRLKMRKNPVMQTLEALMEEKLIERARLPSGDVVFRLLPAA